MLYADYFMINRLSEICQNILIRFVKPKNVLDLYLVAHAHNATLLEQYCIHMLTINEPEVKTSVQWREFERKCKSTGKECLLNKVKQALIN